MLPCHGPPQTTCPELLGTPGQHGSPPRSWWCPVVGMYRLVPNWWVQSGAGECKGSRPALPIHHTTVVLRCSYPAAVHRPSTGVYIYLGGHHWTWGYNHSSALVFKVRMLVYNLTNGFGSFVLILRVCVSTLLVYCSAPLLYPPLTEYTIPPWLGTNL